MDDLIEAIIAALIFFDISAEHGDGEWPIIVRTAEATYGINIEGVENA